MKQRIHPFHGKSSSFFLEPHQRNIFPDSPSRAAGSQLKLSEKIEVDVPAEINASPNSGEWRFGTYYHISNILSHKRVQNSCRYNLFPRYCNYKSHIRKTHNDENTSGSLWGSPFEKDSSYQIWIGNARWLLFQAPVKFFDLIRESKKPLFEVGTYSNCKEIIACRKSVAFAKCW